MFQSDELIYIQMQKTGCTHIAGLLSSIFKGRMVGKHNAATPEQIASTPFFLSSIRNPWDWYLSLWTYGVGGKGGLWQRLVERNLLDAARVSLHSPSVTRTVTQRVLAVRDEFQKDLDAWREAYKGGDDVHAFRRWLRMMHDPANSRLLGEGYADTGLADRFGFMTHRYLILCCRDPQTLTERGVIRSYDDLARFDAEHCYIHQFVRQEALEDTLCAALSCVRKLTPQERALIFESQKTNKSVRLLTITDYYDRDSIDLVGRRDRLIVEKFGYSPPLIPAAASSCER